MFVEINSYTSNKIINEHHFCPLDFCLLDVLVMAFNSQSDPIWPIIVLDKWTANLRSQLKDLHKTKIKICVCGYVYM